MDQKEKEELYLGTVEEWNREAAEDTYIFCLNGNLKKLRKKNHLTQQEMAKILSITQKEYWRYEQDGYKVPLITLFYLAAFYNVSLDYIFGLIPDEKRIFDAKTCINGYNLDDYIQAKKDGMEYIPVTSDRIPEEIQQEYDETDAEFLEQKRKAGLDDDE